MLQPEAEIVALGQPACGQQWLELQHSRGTPEEEVPEVASGALHLRLERPQRHAAP